VSADFVYYMCFCVGSFGKDWVQTLGFDETYLLLFPCCFCVVFVLDLLAKVGCPFLGLLRYGDLVCDL